MKSSKTETLRRFHKIPQVRFKEDRRLTSYGGLVIFQALFRNLELKSRVRRCFRHIDNQGIYGLGNIFVVLIVHLLLGFRRLRGLDYYKNDPMGARVCGLSSLPDASTVSQILEVADATSLVELRNTNQIGDCWYLETSPRFAFSSHTA